MKLNGKKILVTGGNGYLGRQLVLALEDEGAIVYSIDLAASRRKRHFAVDITNRGALEKILPKIKPDIIYHLAAIINRDRDFEKHDVIMQVNYFGTVNLLRALEKYPYENFIFTSTSEIYGNNAAPFHEDQLPQPTSPYSLSKVCAENALTTFSSLYNKNYTILRLFNFFGKEMPIGFFIPQMMDAFKNGIDFKMTEGEQTRDFLYVADVIHALLLAGQNKKAVGEIFNVCSSKAITLKKLVKEVHANMDTRSKIRFGAIPYRENEIWNMLGSNKKIKQKLGFKIEHPFGKAVKALLEG